MRIIAFLADAVAQAHQLAHHDGSRQHAAAKKFQRHDAAELGLGVGGKAGFGDNAVRAFLLHAGKAAKRLVGNVLAKAGQPELVAGQGNHVPDTAAHVLYREDGRIAVHNLMPGMVFPFHRDDFACRRHHAPPEQVVYGGAVFKGHGAAGVLGDVAAYGRSQLGSGINREEGACLADGLLDVLRDAPCLAGNCQPLKINGLYMIHPGQADNDCPFAGRNGAACHARAAAAGNKGKFKLVGKLDELRHLFRGIRLDNHERQLHAQVRGIGCRGNNGGRIRQDAVFRQYFLQFFQQMPAKGFFRLVGGPEHGYAFTDGRCIVVGQRNGIALIVLVHAAANGIRINKRIVGSQKQLFCYGNGKLAHRLRPGLKVINIDAQDTVDDIIRRNRDMRAFLRHGSDSL